MLVTVSHHKKLVDACYPHERLAQPDPNALSRLTYYCSTRPHKIHKVTAYLLAYARAQALPSSFSASLSPYRHSKPGLLCTLQLFQALLRTCQPHLPLFLLDLLAFLAIALGLAHPEPRQPGFIGQGWVGQDADLAFQAVELFAATAHAVGPTSLLDEELARSHLFLLAKFSSIAMVTPSTASLSQPLNFARTLAVVALGETIRSNGLYSSPQFDKQIKLIVPGLLAAILPNDSDRPVEAILSIISELGFDHSATPYADPNPEELDGTLASMQKTLLSSLRHPSSESRETELLRYSLAAINNLLAAPAATHAQYTATLSALLAYASALPPSWLAPALVRWTSLKYRPLLVDALLPQPALLGHVLEQTQLGPVNVLKTLTSLVNHILSGTQATEPLIAAIGALASGTYYPSQSRDVVAHLLQHVAAASEPVSLIAALKLVISHEPEPESLFEVFADTIGSFSSSPHLESLLKFFVDRIGSIETRSPSLARFMLALLSTHYQYLQIIADKRWIELLLALPPSPPTCWPVIAQTWGLDTDDEMISAICNSETVQMLSGLSQEDLKQHFLKRRLPEASSMRRHASIRSVPSPIKTLKGTPASNRLKSLSVSELRDSIKSGSGSLGSKFRSRRRKDYQKELLSELELVVGSTGPRLVVVPPYGP